MLPGEQVSGCYAMCRTAFWLYTYLDSSDGGRGAAPEVSLRHCEYARENEMS